MSKKNPITVSSWTLGDQCKFEDRVIAAKEAGYDYVEISIDETEEKISRLDMTGEERFEMVSAMYETGLPIRTMCVSALTKYSLGNDDPQFSARGMEILEKSIRLADDLGHRKVPPFSGGKVGIQRWKKKQGKCGGKPVFPARRRRAWCGPVIGTFAPARRAVPMFRASRSLGR